MGAIVGRFRPSRQPDSERYHLRAMGYGLSVLKNEAVD
jgi:hypothetical protein